MAQYQEIVDELRSFVLSIDQTLTDRMKEVAGLYVQACNEVNQRLRRCEEFLKKGLRSEAIHLAQTEPNLLDQLAILDFPEHPQWEELAATYGLPVPPQLKVGTASALNEAYADEQPLEVLLRKHRLLALARSSLNGRLAVMRRISQLDSENPVWREDIGNFEKHRFREIQNEWPALTQRGDYEGLAARAEELRATSWVSPAPQSLVKQVENAQGQFRKSWASNTLKSMEAELNDAISAFDVTKARTIRDKWHFLLKDADLPQDDAIVARANVAFEWLSEQERRQATDRAFQDSLDDLESALDKKEAPELLERAYYSALGYGKTIPASLESRYRGRLDDLQDKRIQKRRLIVGAGIAAFVLVVGLIAVGVYRSVKQQKIEDAVAALKKMLDADQLSESRAFLEDLEKNEPQTTRHSELMALRTRLIDAEKREQVRARRFREALKEAEDESPDLGSSLAFERAGALAKKNFEWDALNKAKESRKELFRQGKLGEERAFAKRIDNLNEDLQKLEILPARAQADQAARNLLDKLRDRVSQMQKEADKHGAKAREKVDALIFRLDALRLSIERSQLKVELENKLTASLRRDKDFEAYTSVMEKYCKEFQNDKRSRDFKQVLKEQPFWKGVLEWTAIVLACDGRPWGLKPKEAKAQAQKCREFLQAYPSFIDIDIVKECLKCLEAVAQRDEKSAEGPAHDIQVLLDDFLIKDLWVLKIKDKGTYYLRKKIDDEETESVSFSPVLGFDGKVEGRKAETKNVEQAQAPQSRLAEKIRLILPHLGQSEKTWQETSMEIAAGVHAEPEMDPILRLILFKKVLTLAGKGSYPLWLALSDHRDYLDKLKLNLDVPWMNPENGDANAVRPKAEEAWQKLEKLPSLKTVFEKAANQKKQLEEQISKTERTLIGWLARGENIWECRSEMAPPSGELLLEVLAPGKGSTAAWRTIGKLQNGVANFKPETDGSLLEGRLIFARRIPVPEK
jgi:hypothetical protein